MEKALIEVKNLKTFYPIKGGLLNRTVGHLKAVNDVSLEIPTHRTFGLVGESGCGKSTLGRSLLRLQPVTSGEVIYNGRNIMEFDSKEMMEVRRDMQIIFQDPYGSLNPRFTVREIVREPLDTHGIGDVSSRNQEVMRLLEVCGLRKQVADRYPHEFSGGQRQRVGIARALALNPKFIVADEPVSALDVSVQSQILNLISDLQKEFGISFLFISHDLSVVQHISHEVGVMYFGKVVERASSEDLYKNPKHPYTQSLLSAIPKPDPTVKKERINIKGDIPSHLKPPSGCPFHPRCPVAKPECKTEVPVLKPVRGGEKEHLVSCHLYA
ncbi:MAG: ATP-binding cassette domain-containing protein [Opitutales bacterium]|nr:ATP-binding cassette domain-containing protein [Opitutales bacterium]